MGNSIKQRKGWFIAGCASAVIILMMSSWRVTQRPASVPNTYNATCAACGHQTRIASDMVAQLSFARLHPAQYREQYPDSESPLGQQCAGCGVFHSDFALTVCPRSGKRFIVLRDAHTTMPVTEDALATVSPY